MTIGALSFASPWVLLLLAGLPVIWLLLRNLPPAPKRLAFPGIRLLYPIKQDEQTPFHTPWWLLLLRTIIAALVIIALADPRWNQAQATDDASVFVIVVDNGWPSAHAWQDRMRTLKTLTDQAARQQKQVIFLTTTKSGTVGKIDTNPIPARQAREQVGSVEPVPWLPERGHVAPILDEIRSRLDSRSEDASVYWLTDGLSYEGDETFFAAIEALGGIHVITPTNQETALAIRPAQSGQSGLEIEVLRGHSVNEQTGTVRIIGENGQVLAREAYTLETGKEKKVVTFKLPHELRSQIHQVRLEKSSSAGAVTLVDDRWRRKRVGVAVGGVTNEVQPLLSDIYYIERALSPFADIVKSPMADLLETKDLSVIIVSDVGRFVDEVKSELDDWVQSGGTLIRFAGPRLATQSDDLIPVQLRQGNRTLDGSLSWSKPQQLSDFPQNGPFAGLTATDDVTVSRQVLAEPSVELPNKTWAQLTDGTPLVTGDSRGDGLIALFHITANPDWSTLPLSGLFVEMLSRLVTSAVTIGQDANTSTQMESLGDTQAAMKPIVTLDAYGELGPPPVTTTSVSAKNLSSDCPGPNCPPGFYGDSQSRLAINTVDNNLVLRTIEDLPSAATTQGYQTPSDRLLGPLLFLCAICLLFADTLIALAFAGLFSQIPSFRSAGAAIGTVVLLAGAVLSQEAWAQETSSADEFARRATLETALAYVQTGTASVDDMSYAGLVGLSRTLRDRTAVELGEPIGIDINQHELAFFPLIYWPVVSPQSSLPADVSLKVDHYLKNGGTILFDTQDHQTNLQMLSRGRAGNENLKGLLASLDVPPLEPVSEDHVLTKAFYLLQDFPGRWSGGRLWVEATNAGSSGTGAINDGVSAVIIGSNDYAAAWAEDDMGRPLAAVVPGGDRQREWARRFGVNLVIYSLTGNYKADQVHVPALLERLGQ